MKPTAKDKADVKELSRLHQEGVSHRAQGRLKHFQSCLCRWEHLLANLLARMDLSDVQEIEMINMRER